MEMNIKDLAFDKSAWPAVIDAPAKAKEMRTALVALETNLMQQMNKHGDEDIVWWRKTNGILMQVRRRISETNAAIKEFNKAESAQVAAIEAKWSDFAEELALALDEVAPERLDDIVLKDISAGYWLDKRIAQRNAKMDKEDAR